MVKIRSSDANVGVEIQEETTWGVDPGSWDGAAAFRVPFTSEDIHFEDDVFPDSAEFAALGALLGIDKGRRIVRGTIVVEPQYNNIYFWKLFAQAWGAEDLVVSRSIYDDVTLKTGLNTHGFTPGSGLPVGLAMRVHKSGPDLSGYIDTVLGLIVTRMVWDQPEGDRATVTFDFIGKSISSALAGADAPKAAETPNIKFKATDLERAGSFLHFGATQTELNITGFTLTIDRFVEAGAAFLNNITTLDKPGIVANRAVTIDITSVLEQDYAAAQKPWTEFKASPQVTSKATIGYEADTVAVSPDNYALRFDLPAIVWTDVRPNLSQAGEQPFSASGRAILGAVSGLTGGLADHTTIPSGGSVDVRALCHVAEGDEPSVDAKFSALPNS